MNTPTLEQLQANALAATEALEKAKVEAAELVAKARREQERQAEVARREALRTLPIPTSFFLRKDGLQSIADALNLAIELDTDTKYAKGVKGLASAFVTEPTLLITETDEGPRRNITEAALRVTYRGAITYLGSLDFREELHEILLQALRRKEQAYQNALTVQSNSEALNALRANFQLENHSSILRTNKDVAGTQCVAPEGTLYLKLEKTVTPEQAKYILQACIIAGVKLN